MLTTSMLVEDLRELGVEEGDTLLVHSSIRAVGEMENRADTLLDALCKAVGEEGLLVLPTHTWAYINALNPVFSVEKSTSCVGKLPEIFRKRPDVIRSWHPTHSVAAWGRDAAAFCAGHETFDTPCAWDSPWGRLAQRNGKILMLGVPLTRNTFIHGVEEWEKVPGRLTPGWEPLVTIAPDGRHIDVPSHRHMGNVSEHYDKLGEPLIYTKLAQTGKVGEAFSWLFPAEPLREMTVDFLRHRPDLFIDDAPIPVKWYR
jgi:aminoglycoside 3-N-acetyltransferase